MSIEPALPVVGSCIMSSEGSINLMFSGGRKSLSWAEAATQLMV